MRRGCRSGPLPDVQPLLEWLEGAVWILGVAHEQGVGEVTRLKPLDDVRLGKRALHDALGVPVQPLIWLVGGISLLAYCGDTYNALCTTFIDTTHKRMRSLFWSMRSFSHVCTPTFGFPPPQKQCTSVQTLHCCLAFSLVLLLCLTCHLGKKIVLRFFILGHCRPGRKLPGRKLPGRQVAWRRHVP